MDLRLPEIQRKLRTLADDWSAARAGERANAQLYLTELCTALELEPPRFAGSGYEFEYPVRIVSKDGTESQGRVDLYREGCFVLEAKDIAEGKSNDLLLQKAFGQAHTYARSLPGTPPPFLIIMDVAKTLIVWDRWSGSYGGFNAGRRIELRRLAEHPSDTEFIRAVWTDPASLDPGPRAAAVTREIAERLADLARALESRGHEHERVARFLIRIVFTIFAEDMGLLPERFFQSAIERVGLRDPVAFREALESLWRAMDEGRLFGFAKLLRFNGHFFRDAETLPLSAEDLVVLLEATKADWRFVEPAIFGTLLTRALDPAERHRLGAEYTPRGYVERLVRPTVEEPVRERWTVVQAEVLQLRETGRKKDRDDAVGRLHEFHHWLRSLRILDPACGSGNFLYVTMSVLKKIEMEVLRGIEEITGHPEIKGLEEVGPDQFWGIEIKPWARELAELTLWIGYHQAWVEHHGHVLPPEPVLRDTGTLEQRDAVLAWSERVEDPGRSRPDPTPRIPHFVTGELVPDPAARLSYVEHKGAVPAPWPDADFIVGNPPYLGQARMREAFGDGYVDALRKAYPGVPDSADYVMYWWHRAALAVRSGRTIRAGLITTQSITQAQNRRVISAAAKEGVRVTWAIADHAWCDGSDGAEVRVTMTVLAKDPADARLVAVRYTRYIDGSEPPAIISETRVAALNDDLTAHADVATAARIPLLANQGLSSPGFKLHGAGFILEGEEATRLLSMDHRHARIIRPYRNGKDLTARPRGVSLLDFGLADEEEAREYPVLYNLVRDRVKPERDANARGSYAKYWWRFGEARRDLRETLIGLTRYIATVETSKHRFFTFLDSDVAPDNRLVCIASDDPFTLGVLSSAPHLMWARAAGAALEDKPVYSKTTCFDPFPFPNPPIALRLRIGFVAERLDDHRREGLARDERVTMTGIYNVVDKLRTGEPLSASERHVHEVAACGVILDAHDELDRLVAESYGWQWPLSRDEVLDLLVRTHDERAQEERAGIVRWLREDYQVRRFGGAAMVPVEELDLGSTQEAGGAEQVAPWPATALEQISALKRLASDRGWTVEEAAAHFKGARRDIVGRHLETLAILGELRVAEDGRYRAVA